MCISQTVFGLFVCVYFVVIVSVYCCKYYDNKDLSVKESRD